MLYWGNSIIDSFKQRVSSSPATQNTKEIQSEVTPQSTNNLRKHLQHSLKSLQLSSEDTFRATIPNELPQPVPQNQISKCAIGEDSDLQYKATINGLKVYIDKKVSDDIIQQILQTEGINQFINLLKLLSRSFQTSSEFFHVYYDPDGPTIAFNRNRTLFFNLRYFLTLHYKRTDNLPGSFSNVKTLGCDVIFFKRRFIIIGFLLHAMSLHITLSLIIMQHMSFTLLHLLNHI